MIANLKAETYTKQTEKEVKKSFCDPPKAVAASDPMSDRQSVWDPLEEMADWVISCHCQHAPGRTTGSGRALSIPLRILEPFCLWGGDVPSNLMSQHSDQFQLNPTNCESVNLPLRVSVNCAKSIDFSQLLPFLLSTLQY